MDIPSGPQSLGIIGETGSPNMKPAVWGKASKHKTRYTKSSLEQVIMVSTFYPILAK